MDILLNDDFEFHFNTFSPSDGSSQDADAAPTWAVYEEGVDTPIVTGTCAKRYDAGSTGAYIATGTVSDELYDTGKRYWVKVTGTVTGDGDPVTFSGIPVGWFAVIAAVPAGFGDYAFTLVVQDGDDAAVPACPVRVLNADGVLVAYGLTNTTTGAVLVNLGAGSHAVHLGPLAIYAPANPYSITVSGDATETLVVTAISIPTPVDPSLCVVYADMRNAAGGQLLGAGEGTLNVVQVVSRPAGSTEFLADDSANDAPALTDGSGRAALSIVRGAVVRIRATWPDGHTKTVQLTVPDQDAYDVGADL